MARRMCSWVLVIVAVSGFSTGNLTPLSAAEGVLPADAIQEHLAAGEFAPARRIAESLEDHAARDAQLAIVSRAQGNAGSPVSSLDTIGLMTDDRTRAAALDNFGQQQDAARVALGGVEVDFDGLMDLITSTVAPTTWEGVGGNGSMSPFESGVRVDAGGVLRRVERKASTRLTALVKFEGELRNEDLRVTDARRQSPLRKISLPRLERAVQLRLAAGKPLTEEMRLLAGLERIRYVMVYPQSGDLVLAGPAGDWKPSVEGRLVNAKSGRPVFQLDDLVVILRRLWGEPEATFGCSITPTQEGLARTREFAEASSKTPLKPTGRDAWLATLRERLGRQKIDVFHLDPRTRVAQVLVEADYRMKLVGMGLEDGTAGVESYLDSIHIPAGQAPPPMDVLRWWFTMNYTSLVSTPNRDGFEIRGQGVRVQCENELINGQGERIHTGGASVSNQAFAASFTEHFAALAKKYPVYADLQNLFDLALVIALIRGEGLADLVGWHALCFGNEGEYEVLRGIAPKEVDTVMNHRVIDDKYVIVGVSGGVRVDPWQTVAKRAIEIDSYGKLKAERAVGSAKRGLESDRWWWD